MKIKVNNLGVLRQAEFSLGDLTIICGHNNSGKTYATYALFGFLLRWKRILVDIIAKQTHKGTSHKLLENGHVKVDLEQYITDANRLMRRASKQYSRELARVFASKDKTFENSEFLVDIAEDDIEPAAKTKEFRRKFGAPDKAFFEIKKEIDSLQLKIYLVTEKRKIDLSSRTISEIIAEAIVDVIFSDLLPNPHIASAERTGAAIFRKELNFARNRLFEEMSQADKNTDSLELLFKEQRDFTIPVKRNIEFLQRLDTTAKGSSFLEEQHPDILDSFADIIGGRYIVTANDELYFQPKGARIKLTMDESSSAVRSLLNMGFYLRHKATPSDLLIVDEPELNLHPENQRRIARLFARLVNLGIKVFITTHSDYIVRELNTLIMLNHAKPYLKAIAKRENYLDAELLESSQVKVYTAEAALIEVDGLKKRTKCQTLSPANIYRETGIEAKSFDTTIDTMNRIQDDILWGEDDA